MKRSWGKGGRHTLEQAIEKFLARVRKEENGCWIWTGKLGSHKRYGIVSVAGKVLLTHRASYIFFKGIDPTDMCVLHKCDNGLCVNPAHLFLGTQKDNVWDMENKRRSRHPKLEEHGRAKLTFAKIAEARERVSKGEFIKDIAASFGVNRATLGLALNGRTWITKPCQEGQIFPRNHNGPQEC